MSDTPRYRTAYVVDPGSYDFEPLLAVADNIIYLTNGYEKSLPAMRRAIEANLVGFDPMLDIVVPVGRVLAVFAAADLLARHEHLLVAIYSDRHYEIVNIHNMAAIPTRRMET